MEVRVVGVVGGGDGGGRKWEYWEEVMEVGGGEWWEEMMEGSGGRR